jgi:Tfp pilus assembly pilus retraction ATPase PilT
VSTPLRPIDATALLSFLRFGLTQGATRVHFRVGCPPRFAVHAEEKTLRYRQLAREDTEAIVRLLFERARVPERLGAAPGDAAQELHFYYELPGEALFEVDASREVAGLAVSVEIIRPLTDPSEIALLET